MAYAMPMQSGQQIITVEQMIIYVKNQIEIVVESRKQYPFKTVWVGRNK